MRVIRKVAAQFACAAAVGVACLLPVAAHADACDEACLRTALTGGGAFVFTSSGNITLANGTITVPTNVVSSVDAGSNNVTVTGSSSRILYVESGATVTLVGITFQNGQSTNGGAIYIEPGATVLLTNCIFSLNKAVGADGISGDDGADHKWDNGDNGKRGEPGQDAVGGAIYNLGTLIISRCQFLTNSAAAGSGGDGGNGGASTNYNGGNGGNGGDAGSAFGGAIYNNSSFLWVVETTFSGNFANGGDGGTGGSGGNGGWRGGFAGNGGKGGAASGGAVYSVSFDPNYTNYIWRSTFSDNATTGGVGKDGGGSVTGMGNGGRRGGAASGGGLYNAGLLDLENDTFYHNLITGGDSGNGGAGSRGGNGADGGAASGGGLCNTGSVYVLNCTFSANGAFGGTNGTGGTGISPGRNGHNGAKHGGNIANIVPKKRGYLQLHNTIIGTNVSGGGGFGLVVDLGYNLSADKTLKLKGPGSMIKTNAQLAALGNYGGPTKTLALLVGSPAIDHGDPVNFPPTDQRGNPRPQGAGSDIGAYEFGSLFIEAQPQDQTVSVGASVIFSVGVFGDPPLTYQWYFNDGVDATNVLVSSGSSPIFTISSVSTNNAGLYFVVITNGSGSVTSDVATLTVLLSPSIITQPASQTVVLSNAATFSITAAGQQPLYYQWYFQQNSNSVPSAITDATNTSYTIPAVITNNAGGYFAVVTNDFGAVTSSVATLTVQVAPLITSQPTNQTVATGSTATFSVTAVGAAPLYYQWSFNATNVLDGATNTTLTLSNVQSTNAGAYSVLVTNGFGSVVSSNATLRISSGPPMP